MVKGAVSASRVISLDRTPTFMGHGVRARFHAQALTLVHVRLPKRLLDAKGEYYNAIRYPEFVVQIEDYLKTLVLFSNEEHQRVD